MKILVTGGSGFIGRNLVDYFSPRYEILSPSHRELDLLDEVAVNSYLCRNNVDIIIHGAVRPGHRNAKDPSLQLYHNTRMFFNLIRNDRYFQKMIFLGSGLTYDIRFYQPKMREEYFDTHVPIDEGGFSKYIIAKHIEKVDNVLELRLFGVFGRYEDYAIRFISNAICKTLFNLPVTIKQNRRFDYIYIEDLLPVIEYFLHHQGKFKSYNVTPDHAIELFRLVEIIRDISGKCLPIQVADPGMGMEYSGSNQRIRGEIHDLSFQPFQQSIFKLYQWYTEHENQIDRNLLLFDK